MKNKTIYSILICIFLSCQLFGQKEKAIDSLEKLLPGLHDSARVHVLCELSRIYRLTDLNKSYTRLSESIKLAHRLNLSEKLKMAYTNAVQIHYKMGNIDSSLFYNLRFYEILIGLKDSFEIAQATNNLGVFYKTKGDYVKALEFYKISLDIKKQMNNQLGIAKSLNNLGLVYEQLGSFEKALDYYLQSLGIKRQLDDKSSTAATLVNIGIIYEKLQMDSLAFLSQWEALELYNETGYLKGKATAYNNLGELLRKLGKSEQAYEYFNNALALNDSIKNISGLAYTSNNIGSLLSQQGKPEEAIAMHKAAIGYIESVGDQYGLAGFCLDLSNTYMSINNFQLAENYLVQSLKIAQKEKQIALKYQVILSLSKLKFQQGKYYDAFELQEQGHAIKDSIFNEESKKAIANLQIVHKVDEQQSKIDNLTRTKNIQQEKLKQAEYLTWSLAINLLAFLVFIIVGIVRFRKISKLNKQLSGKQAELKKQNEFLSTLINTIPIPLTYKDIDQKILGCNHFFEEMVGRPEKELIGNTLENYKQGNHLEVHNQMDKKALNEPGIHTYESKILFADKEEHDVIIYKSSFRNEDNKVAGVMAIILDISAQKHYERELLQNEQRLIILNDLHKDLDGLYNDLVLKSHQKICEFTNATHCFCLNWTSDKHRKTELCTFNRENNQLTITEEISIKYVDFPEIETVGKEHKFILIQGQDKRLAYYGSLLNISKAELNELLLLPIIEGDTVVGLAGIVNSDKEIRNLKHLNISLFVSEIWGLLQRKRSLLDLQQSEIKLKESNDAKDKFFSIIAHDLKNPFNAILGFAQLLSEYFHEFQEHEKLQYIQNLYEASETTYRLLENLLQWSFTQTGKMDFKPEEIDLSVFANESAVLFKPTCDKKNIHIQIQIGFNSTVYADPNMVKTIFRNLLSNAIKFSNRGQFIKLTISSEEKFRTVHVIDQGVGIEPENMDKLFKVGEKVKSIGTEDEKGTGLGLLLCKEFVEMNGGFLHVVSQPGKGSTFSFSLPGSQSAIASQHTAVGRLQQ